MIIAFSPNTSRIIPRIFCRKIRHCAPIIYIAPNRYIMYQFVRHGHIAQIYLNTRAIKLLGIHGWRFISIPGMPPYDFMRRARICCRSCVELCKLAIDMHAPCVITPLCMYKRLVLKKCAPSARTRNA